ncbi:MAG: hypothetical protein CM1200mP18_04610 [Gammaproteobacteria bacterium]|nr:MAG: hypothetical protein CM1200mP18_04610 [Gammaproteobacteria bacterium]
MAIDGYECRDSGVGAATSGLAGVRVVRPRDGSTFESWSHIAEFVFFFVLKGGPLHGKFNGPGSRAIQKR